MTDRALVIGIDHYANPDWHLRAAVRDALAFAQWVTEPDAGRATAETLTLLLSPHPDRPVTELPYLQATTSAIQHALLAPKKSVANDVQRFWFFYAGHGMAPQGGGPDQAPIIVPSDQADVEVLQTFPIDLGRFIGDMQVCPPPYQFYFVDACRGLVQSEDVVTAKQTLFYDLSKMKGGGPSSQAVHFATTAAKLAAEQGLHGLFGGALMVGLQGMGPKLIPDPKTQDFELTVSALAEYTTAAIQLKSEELQRQNKEIPTQVPWFSTSGNISNHVLASFPNLPLAPVRVLVEPANPVPNGTASIKAYDTIDNAWKRRGEQKLALPVRWDLSADIHFIEIQAEGYETWLKDVRVLGEMDVPATLKAAAAPAPAPPPPLVRNLFPAIGQLIRSALSEMFTLQVAEAPSRGRVLNGMGTLAVDAVDAYAQIQLFDASGTAVASSLTRLQGTYPAGRYRLDVTFPGERPRTQSIAIAPLNPTIIELRPDPAFTERVPSSAGVIAPNDGFSTPSETFGTATTTRLGSLLAWAASAAQFPPDQNGKKLRSLGVEPVPHETGHCFVRVLVGDTRVPSDQGERQGPIESLSLKFGDDVVQPKPVPGLEGYAVQWSATVGMNGSIIISADGLNPKRFPLPFLAGCVWTIVIARETAQQTEIHRYLDPVSPVTPFDDTIRLIEQNWRALDARLPLFADEAARLLKRKLDPLALVVLGYRLLGEDRKDALREVLARLEGANLADVPVLAAALTDRDENMKRALSIVPGPLVGEGFRALETWLTELNGEAGNVPPPRPTEPVTAGFWTSFDPRGLPVAAKAFLVQDAPDWASPLLPAAQATARIEPQEGPIPYVGTGFLLAPDRLVLANFSASMLKKATSGLLEGATARFEGTRVAIETILGTTDDERHAALARLGHFDGVPAKLRYVLPEVGDRIAIIGYPTMDDSRVPIEAANAAFATSPKGQKMIMPGVITEVTPTRITYECWTMAGVAGGPVVDLKSGEVIGMHHSGRYEGGTRKTGWGVPLTAIAELLGKDAQ